MSFRTAAATKALLDLNKRTDWLDEWNYLALLYGMFPATVKSPVGKTDHSHSLLAYAYSRRQAGCCTVCGNPRPMKWTGMDECFCYLNSNSKGETK